MKKKINFKVLILSLVIVYSFAFIGSLFTSIDNSWYDSVRPSITPPSFVFPIVWNILFFLIALSLYIAWINSNKIEKKKVAFVFGTNLVLNAFWSFLYFGLQNPLYAFIDLILIWVSILGMIFVTYKIKKISAYLLIPYLLWVSFAGVLNWLSIK
ncbi:MAG: tryptophan-rich sensory protein [Candidatus Pacearchaeota archaeon]|nr:tryptophan-rich sensory protein [Candidatus Pacearchaeota archaeon]